MAALAAVAARAVAFTSLRVPPNAPKGVRFAATIHTSRGDGTDIAPASLRLGPRRRGTAGGGAGLALALGQRRARRRHGAEAHLRLQRGHSASGAAAGR